MIIPREYGLTMTSIKKYGFKLALVVFDKYKRQCSECESDEKLVIHHIAGSGESKKPNNDIENLQLLCNFCHSRLHANKRWKVKIKEQGGYKFFGNEKEYWKKRLEKVKKGRKPAEDNEKSEYQKKYQQEHAEELKEYRKEYRKKNAQRIKEYQKNYWKSQ